MKKFLLSIAAVMLAVFSVQAQSELYYTLAPAKGTNNTYAGNCDIVIEGITWNLTGNSTMLPWRIGGKSLTNQDRALYSKTPLTYNINKVVLSVGTMNSITVNNAKLLVADNPEFTNPVETSFTPVANSDIEIAVSAAVGSYYKFVFNVSVSGDSNKFIQISKVEFYGSESANATPTLTTPTFSKPAGKIVNPFDLTISAEEGATIYYTLNGEDPTTESTKYEGAINITATTTVKAFAVKADYNNSPVAEVTYTFVEVSDIADIIAAGAGDAVAKGTVVATYNVGFLMSDETGYILVYQGSNKGFVAGDVVTVIGATSEYGGLMQFGNSATVEKTGTAEVNHPEATVLDGAALDAFVDDLKVQYVEYTGTLNISNNKYYNVEVEGATAQGSIQYPNDGFITVESGTEVKVTGYIIGVSSGKYVNTMAVKVEEVVPTAIEGVETEAAEQVIYDLTGRRVETITETGIYIVNGKKVFVK